MSHYDPNGNPREGVCHEIAETLRTVTRAHSEGTIGEQGFADLLLRIEAEKARPNGLILTASNTRDDWTVVMLRRKGESDPCASFEYLPGAGAFRPAGSC